MRKEKTFVMGIQNPANKEIIKAKKILKELKNLLELFDLFF